MRLLMTRPEPDASLSAQRLRSLGHEVIVSPVLQVTYSNELLSWKSDAALVVTSKNGVRALDALVTDEMRKKATVFTVGDATAALASNAGFMSVTSASGTVDDLVDLIAGKKLAQVHYICGRDRNDGLETKLQRLGILIKSAERYHADFASCLNEEAIKAFKNQDIDGVLLYSTRSAEAFNHLLKANKVSYSTKQMTYFCLAKAITSVLDREMGIHAVVADRPNEQSLYDAIEAYVKTC